MALLRVLLLLALVTAIAAQLKVEKSQLRTSNVSRVIGGTYASYDDESKQAGIFYIIPGTNYAAVCTATCIYNSKDTACAAGKKYYSALYLTAAHCTHKTASCEAHYVTPTYSDFYMPETYSASDIFVHPEFNPYTLNNDFALVRITHIPCGVDTKVRPLAENCDACKDDAVTVWGYGVRRTGGPASPFLITGAMTVNSDCCTNYFAPDYCPETQICAGGKSFACYGDSGGPVTNKYGEIMAVTSYGESNCNSCAAFGKICAVREWIECAKAKARLWESSAGRKLEFCGCDQCPTFCNSRKGEKECTK